MNDFLGDLLKIGKRVIEASEAMQAEIDRQSPVMPSVAERAPTPERAATASTETAVANAAADLFGQTPTKEQPTYSDLYVRHLMAGCPDPMTLLTVEEAEQFLGCKVLPSTTGEEEYIGCHYGCADDRSMYVALTVSARMPWDFVTQEVTTKPAPRPVGDEAFVSDDFLYVRKGEHFFWIYGRGVDQQTIFRIADHAANRLAD